MRCRSDILQEGRQLEKVIVYVVSGARYDDSRLSDSRSIAMTRMGNDKRVMIRYSRRSPEKDPVDVS